MEPLLGKNIEELRAVCAQYGLKPFAASQMADWLYRKRVRSIEEMTNLPKAARAALARRTVRRSTSSPSVPGWRP